MISIVVSHLIFQTTGTSIQGHFEIYNETLYNKSIKELSQVLKFLPVLLCSNAPPHKPRRTANQLEMTWRDKMKAVLPCNNHVLPVPPICEILTALQNYNPMTLTFSGICNLPNNMIQYQLNSH